MELLLEDIVRIGDSRKHCKVGCAVTLLAGRRENLTTFLVRHQAKADDGVTLGQWGPISETVRLVCESSGLVRPETSLETSLRAIEEEVAPNTDPGLRDPRGAKLPHFDWDMGPGRLPTYATARYLYAAKPDAMLDGSSHDEIIDGRWVGLQELHAELRDNHRAFRHGVAAWFGVVAAELSEVITTIENAELDAVPEYALQQGLDIRFDDGLFQSMLANALATAD